MDKETHRLLTLFGDNKSHSFFETCILGSILMKTNQRKLEALFKRRLLANGLVKRMWQSWSPRMDFYILTLKGDECFRALQIQLLRRTKATKDSEEAIRHYKYFTREATGQFGVEGMGSNEINDKTARLREKFPHLYAR